MVINIFYQGRNNLCYVAIDRTNWSRIKEYGRIERRHSSFYIGLYGQTWVNFKDVCMDLVTKLMKLNRNKCKYYQQGLRAMKLIESVL
ncbi:hypothetical protein PL9631_230002 [Planktothrix paucivesiculata PCC 9631]|uniref:Mobile element protein n=1 Tax=Planktothrix paucivesiculata PCC 9631 TaxID=671071 RepID=A0A7Z9DXG2_9CYAN|nr:hypothetical protein PL9631_230002 [Planktothrix paucivesiculata PCC 9631]